MVKEQPIFCDANSSKCCFIVGETHGANTHICGDPVERGSYCAIHADLCYSQKRKKKDDEKGRKFILHYIGVS